ncbi:MAG: methyltransferase domain-containing protein [Deltaproteobacteria bacterium]|nr:methyltransferase domain-containing protein [Deltaproteobacteria bacterium]
MQNPCKEIFDKDAMAVAGAYDQYFRVGNNALEIIEKSLELSGRRGDPKCIFDFPCGAGRVTRWLRARWPNASIYVSDLSKQEMDWCVGKFGCIEVEPHVDFESVVLSQKMDLVWCGSLLTHLSEERALQLLSCMSSWIKLGGVFVATTHGRGRINQLYNGSASGLKTEETDRVIADASKNGYGYGDYSNNKYGFSVNKPSWLIDWVEKQADLKLILMSEGLWGGRQDVFAVSKVAPSFCFSL